MRLIVSLNCLLLLLALPHLSPAQQRTTVFIKNIKKEKHQAMQLINKSTQVEVKRVIWFEKLGGYLDCSATTGAVLRKLTPILELGEPIDCDFEAPYRIRVAFSSDSLKRYLEDIKTDDIVLYAGTSTTIKTDDGLIIEIPFTTIPGFDFLETYAKLGRQPNYNTGYAVATTGISAIQFPYNSAVLASSSYPILDALATSLRVNHDSKIVLEGHTASDEGTDSYLMNLSRDRASSVKTYLVNSGISAQRITIQAVGESRPIASNATEEGRSQNRRVEIKR